jgi:hypothetical protein
MLKLKYFTIVCNAHENKMMNVGSTLGQLYDVHNKIKIFQKHWLGQHTYYDNINVP